ncbi:NUDIX domain-containing protein [Oenococcus sp. UCMA 16435]|nr:NUDIX domain-containing protein [Oenococcus sp. UCMA 16435]MDI4584568.1 NUDIX domain-containing protein [Oenococcus sp. UCMA 14587]
MSDEANDIVFRSELHDFKVRVTGVLFNKENRVALNPDKNDSENPYVTLPGGKLKFGETSEQAIIREFAEEMGLKVKTIRLLAVTENLYTYQQKHNNEINFTWLVKRADQESVFAKDMNEQTVIWRDPRQLEDFLPKNLGAIITSLPKTPVHLVSHN